MVFQAQEGDALQISSRRLGLPLRNILREQNEIDTRLGRYVIKQNAVYPD